MMMLGWMFSSSRSPAFFSSSPASSTAVVVPSPTSLSWVLATSIIILAAGCCTSISSSTVAPSLVMVMSPRLSMSILSMPLGPRVVFRTSAMICAASMLLLRASRPLVLSVSSFRITTGCPP